MIAAVEAVAAPGGQPAAVPHPDPIVRVSGLTKGFPVRRGWREMLRRPWERAARTTVVDDVSFEVPTGELFGLLGANGAGKTTLFRMLATHVCPDSGSASIDGRDVVGDARGVRGRLAQVGTDERSLHWRLTARENLELFAALYGVPRGRTAERIEELLRTVELEATGDKTVGTFSSGMKQRLLIARALLARPRVLLLDEPTRSLDPISARRLRHFLREEIVGRQGCTVLLATHNAEEAFELCDRVAVLEKGRLLAVGKVRDLVGEMSDDRYHVEVRESHVRLAVRLLGAGGCDPEVLPDAVSAGWLGVRALVPGGADGAADTLARLARAGVDVARFQRIDLTLADLIERVVARRSRTNHA